jgi:hypothetical protein
MNIRTHIALVGIYCNFCVFSNATFAACVSQPDVLQRFVRQIGFDNEVTINSVECSLDKTKLSFTYSAKHPDLQETYENAFKKKNGSSYWQVLFLRISQRYDLALEDISGHGPGANGLECGSSYIIMFKKSGFYNGMGQMVAGVARGDLGCMSGVVVEEMSHLYTKKTVSGNVETVVHTKFDARALYAILKEYFEDRHGTVNAITLNDQYVYFSAIGLQNVVLAGMNVWEKLNVLVVVIPDASDETKSSDRWKIVFTVDGYFTGGGAKIPPVAAFTNSMDPQYFKQLDEFSNILATTAIAQLEVPQ